MNQERYKDLQETIDSLKNCLKSYTVNKSILIDLGDYDKFVENLNTKIYNLRKEQHDLLTNSLESKHKVVKKTKTIKI